MPDIDARVRFNNMPPPLQAESPCTAACVTQACIYTVYIHAVPSRLVPGIARMQEDNIPNPNAKTHAEGQLSQSECCGACPNCSTTERCIQDRRALHTTPHCLTLLGHTCVTSNGANTRACMSWCRQTHEEHTHNPAGRLQKKPTHSAVAVPPISPVLADWSGRLGPCGTILAVVVLETQHPSAIHTRPTPSVHGMRSTCAGASRTWN
jgi:hypothetical protein